MDAGKRIFVEWKIENKNNLICAGHHKNHLVQCQYLPDHHIWDENWAFPHEIEASGVGAQVGQGWQGGANDDPVSSGISLIFLIRENDRDESGGKTRLGLKVMLGAFEVAWILFGMNNCSIIMIRRDDRKTSRNLKEMVLDGTFILCSGPKTALSGPKMTQNGLKWPEPIEIAIWNNFPWISASLAVILSGHITSLQQLWVWGQKWPKMAEKGSKCPKMAQMSEKWHPKPSPLDFCFSCGHFEWSHD